LCADAGIPLSQMTVGLHPLVAENETRPSLSPRSQVRQFPS
jgi:hypothetical protein